MDVALIGNVRYVADNYLNAIFILSETIAGILPHIRTLRTVSRPASRPTVYELAVLNNQCNV